jgi:hypothetical protein
VLENIARVVIYTKPQHAMNEDNPNKYGEAQAKGHTPSELYHSPNAKVVAYLSIR